MPKAIIFGSNGQDGYYLRKLLESEKVETIGVSRSLPAGIIGSVADYDLVSELIKKEKPDYIFHLAANSSTRHDALWDNHDAIVTGTLNILESAYQFSKNSKIFLSGSGLQFENKNLPIDEEAPLVSTSPYVVARNYSLYARRYYRSLGLKVFFGFLFNHDSPKRGERHMAQKIASYCRNISGQNEKLLIGNIDIKKEWTYAGDVVHAMWTLVNQESQFEVVIGSGLSYSIKQWLEVCFKRIEKDWQQYVEVNSGFIPEYDTLVSNPKRLMSLGWRPQIDFYQLAEMMMNQTDL
jgi:GDPmannose 4,6-dehydratase